MVYKILHKREVSIDEKVNIFNDLHYVFLESGYKRIKSKLFEYKKDLTIGTISLPIKVILYDTEFERWPEVYLTKIPDQISGRIAHVLEDDNRVCYFDADSIELDRYYPKDNLALILQQVDNLLADCVSSPEFSKLEIRRELSYYWQGSNYQNCFLLSCSHKLLYLAYEKLSDSTNNSIFEVVISKSDNDNRIWAERRGLKDKINSGPAYIIKLPDSLAIPQEDWPPEEFSHVLKWFENNNGQPQASQLLDIAFSALGLESSFLIIFKSGSIHLGCLFNLKNNIYQNPLINAHKRIRNKKGVGIKKLQKKSLVLKCLQKENSLYFRFLIQLATEDYIIGRNLVSSNLKGLNICIIGCGTIGGYVAHLLTQVGAGFGAGKISLFDSGVLETGNLGRHLLGVKYLGENKSTALANYLLDSSPAQISIVSENTDFDLEKIGKYSSLFDYIIDATGNYNFSISLSHRMHRLKISVPVIHSWVDAGGLVSRSLLDDFSNRFSCYYCITGSPFSPSREKLLLPNISTPEWMPDACGIGSFMPFSSQASVNAAGLVQGLMIDHVNGNPTPRFRQITIDETKAAQRKSKNIKPDNTCRCCQKIN